MELSNQGKWLLGSTLVTIGTILFIFGWTSPFWPPWFGWLGLPIVKTVFPIAFTLVFIVLFFYGLTLISRTDPPPTEIVDTTE